MVCLFVRFLCFQKVAKFLLNTIAVERLHRREMLWLEAVGEYSRVYDFVSFYGNKEGKISEFRLWKK